jgi:hypothetical protein
MIGRLDREIALHQASLDGAADRFEHRQAATQAVIDHGLQQQRHATNLAERLATERNHLDGIPSAAEIRRAAIQRERLKGFAPASQVPPAPDSPAIEM